MHYPLENGFKTIAAQGVEKVVAMIKLALKEMPRLQTAFLDPKIQKEAKIEIRWILDKIGTEMDTLLLTHSSDDKALQSAIYNRKNFSPEEWEALNRFIHLLKQLDPLLFTDEAKPQKLKWIYPKA